MSGGEEELRIATKSNKIHLSFRVEKKCQLGVTKNI